MPNKFFKYYKYSIIKRSRRNVLKEKRFFPKLLISKLLRLTSWWVLFISFFFHFKISDPPELISNPLAKEVVNKDAILRLSCVATANELASFSWYKDGVLIAPSVTHTITNAEQQPDEWSTTSSLKVTGVDTTDAGSYSCNATNSLGVASFVTEVDVLCKCLFLSSSLKIFIKVIIVVLFKLSLFMLFHVLWVFSSKNLKPKICYL